jgi:predicted transcriptional regulator
MQWQKTPIEIKAKIIEAKINRNAQWSVIAEELGIPERTVNNIIQHDLAEVCRESESVSNLIDRNDRLQSLADERIERMIQNWEENIKLSELVSVRESAWKQNQVIKWDPTENIKHVITDITIA